MLDFSVLTSTSANPALVSIIYAILLAFVLGTALAVLYTGTFQGLTYSRNFLHSLILSPIVVSIVMQAIGNNLATGVGMIGAVSMLRFRSNVKDPRDMFFLFASLAVGVACGVYSYSIAVVGTLGFILAVLVLAKTPFTCTTRFDGLLRFQLPSSGDTQIELQKLLSAYCKTFALVSLREAGQGAQLDYTYQVKMKKDVSHRELVQNIRALEGARGIQVMLQEATVEV